METQFIINSYKIRLEGIDAPEMKQKCRKPYLQISFYFSKRLLGLWKVIKKKKL